MCKIECCNGCTPETGRTVLDEFGRNCHSYCKKYLEAKAIAEIEEENDRKKRKAQNEYYEVAKKRKTRALRKIKR